MRDNMPFENTYPTWPNESMRYRVPLFGLFAPQDQHLLQHAAGFHDLLPDPFVDALCELEFDLVEPEVALHGKGPVRHTDVEASVALVARP